MGTTYTDKGPKPAVGSYHGFHSVELWVGNAQQAEVFYCARMGFKPLAYQGLETGNRAVCKRVVAQNDVRIVLSTPLNPSGPESDAMGAHIKQHGDGVRVVSFKVDDCAGIY